MVYLYIDRASRSVYFGYFIKTKRDNRTVELYILRSYPSTLSLALLEAERSKARLIHRLWRWRRRPSTEVINVGAIDGTN